MMVMTMVHFMMHHLVVHHVMVMHFVMHLHFTVLVFHGLGARQAEDQTGSCDGNRDYALH